MYIYRHICSCTNTKRKTPDTQRSYSHKGTHARSDNSNRENKSILIINQTKYSINTLQELLTSAPCHALKAGSQLVETSTVYRFLDYVETSKAVVHSPVHLCGLLSHYFMICFKFYCLLHRFKSTMVCTTTLKVTTQ